MQDFEQQPARYLVTVEELLIAERMTQAAETLRESTPRVQRTGFDNWNGGTEQWTVFLAVDTAAYALLGVAKANVEEQITQRLKAVLEPYTQDWFSAKIVPRIAAAGAVAAPNTRIRRQTRQNIIDGLTIDSVSWSGSLDDVDFLARIYDLQALPSYDGRYEDASGDIYQHRVNNFDWDDGWVFDDARFALRSGPDEQFLRFLCEIVHPVVRPDKDEAIKLAAQFNDQLRQDGWELVEVERIAGRPRFVARRPGLAGDRSASRARTVADALDAGWMQKEIERLELAVESDPALAIGTAKDLVETCCKSILTRQSIDFSRKSTLPELTKLLTKELKLVPEGISDEAKGAETIRLLLRNLTTITQYLSEIRSLYGTGHGRDGKHRGLEPRHARLAVGAAVAFIDFVSETYHQRISNARVL
ncbi:abortive infection family protein [Novosphingobium terrae]|uniref:abortive infection family protein n=1 Tax=Novosphingobium terrae TaxID=2726189 RepID=UPI001F13E901|nr:abortive infection family protein [Novosphingobium terrae]